MSITIFLTSLLVLTYYYQKISRSRASRHRYADYATFPDEIKKNSHQSFSVFSNSRKNILDIRKLKNIKLLKEYNSLLSITRSNFSEHAAALKKKLKDETFALREKLHEIILQNMDFSDSDNLELAELLENCSNTDAGQRDFPLQEESIDDYFRNELNSMKLQATFVKKEDQDIESRDLSSRMSKVISISDDERELMFVQLLRIVLNQEENTSLRILALDRLNTSNSAFQNCFQKLLNTETDAGVISHVLLKTWKAGLKTGISSDQIINLMKPENKFLDSMLIYMHQQGLLELDLAELEQACPEHQKYLDRLCTQEKETAENSVKLEKAVHPSDLLHAMDHIHKYDGTVLAELEKLTLHNDQKVVGKALYLLNCHYGDKEFKARFLDELLNKKPEKSVDPVLSNYILNIPENLWNNKNAVVDFLAEKASSKSPVVKEQIAYTLAHFHSNNSRMLLRTLILDHSSHVNYAALVSFGIIGTEKDIPVINQFINTHPKNQNTQIAEQAIKLIRNRSRNKDTKSTVPDKIAIA